MPCPPPPPGFPQEMLLGSPRPPPPAPCNCPVEELPAAKRSRYAIKFNSCKEQLVWCQQSTKYASTNLSSIFILDFHGFRSIFFVTFLYLTPKFRLLVPALSRQLLIRGFLGFRFLTADLHEKLSPCLPLSLRPVGVAPPWYPLPSASRLPLIRMS